MYSGHLDMTLSTGDTQTKRATFPCKPSAANLKRAAELTMADPRWVACREAGITIDRVMFRDLRTRRLIVGWAK